MVELDTSNIATKNVISISQQANTIRCFIWPFVVPDTQWDRYTPE